MARRCELSGIGPVSGNNVSHSHKKTKRRFLPNLCDVTLTSEKLGRSFSMRVSAATLRTVDKMGGLDHYLAKAKVDQLSDQAQRIKRALKKADRETLLEKVE
ncbi:MULTISPECIES: 50S ribosomal protein L28 [Euryhalocaulis]|uniref:50S ribosomal protein L28 n=1 Tax=Euryhalocaulis TaxID=1712422 RepID=UPI0003A9F400|nr:MULTISPECIES: 50S ribosomal protein L28 [Euryhalocaulis]MBA4800532.1 50S ribosomal protein L28 [Euryhalocaulis sp.]